MAIRGGERGSGAPISIDQLLAEMRVRLNRLSPRQAEALVRNGDALLIDIRSDRQRAADGLLPDATVVPRNVLEWRLDPSCPHRDPALSRRDKVLILICDEGYQSSLAAATVQRFGLNATDVVGGFVAWREVGLAIDLGSDPSRSTAV